MVVYVLGIVGPIFFSISLVTSAPTADQYPRGVDWLSRYGYLPPPDMRSGRLHTKETIERAIREMQRFAGLKETGTLDRATTELMEKPRCSLPDVIGTEDLLRKRKKRKRKKRYSLTGLRWHKHDISWSVLNFPSPSRSPWLRPELVETLLTYALRAWGAHTPLRFHLVHPKTQAERQEVDIEVSFPRGYHDDGYPFDGRGGTLAHAFFPGTGDMAGNTHFDDGEHWSYGGHDNGTTDLFAVAVHEFGHALGLSHSSYIPSIMRPYYQGSVGDFRHYTLPRDDQLGIQALYGRGDSTLPTPAMPQLPSIPSHLPPRPTNHPLPALPNRCDGGYDAIANIRGEVFFFSGKFFWRVQHSGSLLSFIPALIKNFWIGLPHHMDRIDAVYERTNGQIVFFIGNQYWVFKDRAALPDYPRPLAEWGMRTSAGHIPAKLEAAFVWAHNGKTYLFSGGEFWRFDERGGDMRQEVGYPKSATLWAGVPSHPDDIISWADGDTYFFKGSSYWVLRRGGLNEGDIQPKSSAVDWMKCDPPPPEPSAPPKPTPPCCCRGLALSPSVLHLLSALALLLMCHQRP
ncbi:matrix metalloproteinase-25 [Engraulis encrasicolus]|uniref:matrix metalloproteinase-25 n=1 Tax=Engraulis encrasicolus TaxID=184585 RepID=UPI002FCE7B02